jgi:hypothetical protein
MSLYSRLGYLLGCVFAGAFVASIMGWLGVNAGGFIAVMQRDDGNPMGVPMAVVICGAIGMVVGFLVGVIGAHRVFRLWQGNVGGASR